jgi:hypothetical protein
VQASLKQLFPRGKKLKHKIRIENKFINEKKMQYVVTSPLKPSLFISLCILRDLPQQKIPRASCGGGDPVSLYFHIPMFLWKDFLMGRIRKIQNHEEERDRSGKFKKTRRKEWRKEKEKEIFMYVEVSIPMCCPSVGNALGLPPSCDPPSGEPTLVGTSPTTKVHELGKKQCPKPLMEFKSY